MDLSSVLIWAAGARNPGAVAASQVAALTLTQIVITAVAAVIVFVAVLVGVLEISRRRARHGGEEENCIRREAFHESLLILPIFEVTAYC